MLGCNTDEEEVHEGHDDKQSLEIFELLELLVSTDKALGQTKGNVVETERFGQPPIDISAELIAQYNCGQDTIFGTHPVPYLTMTDIHQILFKQIGDFLIYVWSTSEPSFHHLRW